MIFVADIQRAVAREYRVPFSIMIQPDGVGVRQREHSHPRQVAMALSALLSDHSMVRIGQFFHRDRTTVMHAVNAVETRRLDGGRKGLKVHNVMRRVTLGLVRR